MNRSSRVVAPATAAALTTLATAKAELGIETAESDAYLSRRIAAASAAIAAQCGRTFGRETVEDTFSIDPWGRDPAFLATPRRQVEPLLLSRPFVAALHGVTVGGEARPLEQTWLDAPAGLLFRRDAGGGLVHWVQLPVVVTYTSGWVLPGDPATDLPATVEDVCLDLIVESWHARGRDPAIRDEQTEGVGRIRYADAPAGERPLDPRLAPYVLRCT